MARFHLLLQRLQDKDQSSQEVNPFDTRIYWFESAGDKNFKHGVCKYDAFVSRIPNDLVNNGSLNAIALDAAFRVVEGCS